MNVYFNGTWGTEQKYIYKCTCTYEKSSEEKEFEEIELIFKKYIWTTFSIN